MQKPAKTLPVSNAANATKGFGLCAIGPRVTDLRFEGFWRRWTWQVKLSEYTNSKKGRTSLLRILAGINERTFSGLHRSSPGGRFPCRSIPHQAAARNTSLTGKLNPVPSPHCLTGVEFASGWYLVVVHYYIKHPPKTQMVYDKTG